jgi:hypothetical protein
MFRALLNHRDSPAGAFLMEEQFTSRPRNEHLREAIPRRKDGGQKHDDRDAASCPAIRAADTSPKPNRDETDCAGCGS